MHTFTKRRDGGTLIHLVFLVVWMFCFGTGTACADSITRSEHIDTESQETDQLNSAMSLAREWGLTDNEWTRYERLKHGRRGVLSPELDPITALGIEARNDAERRRYAEMLVKLEYQRVEAELAFQRAYDEAWERLHPDLDLVSPFETGRSKSARLLLGGEGGEAGPSRVDVIVAINNCALCDTAVNRLLVNGGLMDIWVTGDVSDQDIRDWAARIGIPASRVQAGEITLNHGNRLSGQFETLPQILPKW